MKTSSYKSIAGAALMSALSCQVAFADPGFNGHLNFEGARSTVGAWCTHTGISVACDRALQGLAVGGVAINTANPGDLQVDSSNVPRAPMQCKQGPAPACSYGYRSGPTYDSTSCSWNYSCVPQSAQPPASVCPNGFASGPTFNAASNSWSYSCNVCTNVTQTPVSCSTYAGQYGIPAGYTVGSASWTKNSCNGAVTYLGGCSAPAPSYSFPAAVTPASTSVAVQAQPHVLPVLPVTPTNTSTSVHAQPHVLPALPVTTTKNPAPAKSPAPAPAKSTVKCWSGGGKGSGHLLCSNGFYMSGGSAGNIYSQGGRGSPGFKGTIVNGVPIPTGGVHHR